MQNPVKERILKIAFFPHLSEMEASARKGLMGRCRTSVYRSLSLNDDQQVLAGETDASFLLFWVGSIKNVVNHYPAHDCRGYRFRIDVVEDSIWRKNTEHKTKDEETLSEQEIRWTISLSRSGCKG